jgi:predicted extracellular nuclease
MRRNFVVLAVVTLLLAGFASAASPNVVISQVYGGGGNSGAPFKNDFVELFNRGGASVALAGMSIQYASATGTGNFGGNPITALNGSLAPGQYYLVQLAGGTNGVALPAPDATGTANISGTGGKVALVSTTAGLACNGSSNPCTAAQLAQVIDLVGWDGANFFEGAAAPATSNSTAVFRAGGGCTDTDNNAADFSAGAPTPRNTASPFHFCSGPTNPSGVGAANPASVPAGDSTLLTVAVTPGANPLSTGLSVTANLSAIGGSAIQPLFDDGTNGDVTAGDNTFSYQATVGGAVTAGSKTLAATITDAQARTGSASIALSIEPPLVAIHEIQGPGTTSPYVGQLVATTGIVTGIRYNNGIFIQTPDGDIDADPSTSEGIFVYTGGAPPAAAVVGSSVKVTGTVQEYIPSTDPYSPPMTEIIDPAVTVISTGNPLPAAVTLTAADTNPAGGLEQLEKFEGMRVHVDSLTVVAPTEGTVTEASATASSNGVFYGVLPGVARPFVEAGVQVPDALPAGAPANVPRFDANPEKLRVNSRGLKGATSLEVTSGATVTNITGPLDYAYRAYTILPDVGTLTPASVTGNIAAIPVPDACPAELTVATANLERFYDTTNDPSTSDVVLTDAAFANRLNKVSLAIRNVMKFPDIVGVEEMEDLTTLQALAAKVNGDAVAAGQADPLYAAYLEEGNDIGGIDVGFLVKTPKVAVVDVTQAGKDATYIDPNTNKATMLNDRPPLVLRALVTPPTGAAFPVTVIVNHLRSLSGVEDLVDGRVRAKRAAQAEYLANLIQEHQGAGEKVMSVGDYNATQFNDGYVDVIGTILGTPAPLDEVVLATTAGLVDPTLTDLLGFAPADQRYSYVYDGNAQDLDHVLVTSNLVTRVNGLYYARDNADFPESYRSDANRPERYSDHDPVVAYVQLPTVIANASANPPILWPANHKMVPVTINYDLGNVCTVDPVSVTLSISSSEPANGIGDGTTEPDWVLVDAHHVLLRAERSGLNGGRVYTITITATDSRGNVSTQTVTVTVPHNK